jgi:ABC-2 type transport system permease protein
MSTVWTIAVNEWRLLLRDRVAAALTLLMPFAYAGFFGVLYDAIGREIYQMRIEIAVVDLAGNDASAKLLTAMSQTKELRYEVMSADAANEAVKRGDLAALVEIPEDFELSLATLTQRDLDPLYVRHSSARKVEGRVLRSILWRLVVEAVQNSIGSGGLIPGMQGKLRAPVVLAPVEQTDARPETALDVSFPQGMIWGVLSCAAAFGAGVATDRSRGTLTRIFLTPISRATYLAGKALACAVTIVVLCGLMLAGGLLAGLTPHSLGQLVVSVLATAVGFTGVMMLLATLLRGQAASGSAWAVMMVLGVLGGGLIPSFLMPPWLEAASYASPVRWTLLLFEGPLWRFYTWGDLMLPVVVIVGLGVVCFGVGAVRLSRMVVR